MCGSSTLWLYYCLKTAKVIIKDEHDADKPKSIQKLTIISHGVWAHTYLNGSMCQAAFPKSFAIQKYAIWSMICYFMVIFLKLLSYQICIIVE